MDIYKICKEPTLIMVAHLQKLPDNEKPGVGLAIRAPVDKKFISELGKSEVLLCTLAISRDSVHNLVTTFRELFGKDEILEVLNEHGSTKMDRPDAVEEKQEVAGFEAEIITGGDPYEGESAV